MFRNHNISIRVHHCEEDFQMEEQTVPSAGFSPQPEYMTGGGADSASYYGNGVVHLQPPQQHMHHPQQQQQQHYHQQNPVATSTLGNGNAGGCYDYNTSFETFDLSLLGDYEDRDMATVPSPSASCWSPLGALEPTACPQMSFYAASPPEYRAFSPDCKPFNTAAQAESSAAQLGSNNQAAPQQQQLLDNSSAAGAGALSNNNSGSDDANTHAHLQQAHNNGNNNALLRQCLADNTFIEKYNYKPLDLPITALPSTNEAAGVVVDSAMERNSSNGGTRVPSGPTDAVGSATLDMNLEPVFSLAYETIISDIQNHCRTLGISPDPMQWSVENVQSWLALYSSEKRSGSAAGDDTVLRSLWNIDGQQLCALSEQEFRQRDPLNGEKIFANLELLKMWKSVGVTASASSCSSSAGPQPFDFVQLLNCCSPSSSVGVASPAPSFVQDEMQSSPAVAAGVTIKVELDENMQPITTLSQAKFSNPGSVDTASSASSSSLRNSDDDEEVDEEEDKPSSGATGITGTTKKTCGTKNGAHIHLWQFLKELLASGQQHGSCIRWLDQGRGVFKIEDSVRVARLWGIRKNRPAMNYDKLSRSIRQYYRKGIMRKTERSQRLVYQFCPPYGL